MIDFLFEKFMIIVIIGIIPLGLYSNHKGNAELQTILKNECGMEYTKGEVRRNGENLSRICGLKND